MDNREKALELVQKCLDEWPYAATRVVDIMNRLEQVKALLKDQEAKPITYTDNPYTGLPYARCPKCAGYATQFYSMSTEETHYCPWCGQAVKWE